MTMFVAIGSNLERQIWERKLPCVKAHAHFNADVSNMSVTHTKHHVQNANGIIPNCCSKQHMRGHEEENMDGKGDFHVQPHGILKQTGNGKNLMMTSYEDIKLINMKDDDTDSVLGDDWLDEIQCIVDNVMYKSTGQLGRLSI